MTEPLFDLSRPHRRGRTERAVDAAVRAARKADLLSELDAAIVAAARGLARHLDELEHAAKPEPGTFAYVAIEFRKTLVECGLTPMSREEADDEDAGAELAAVLRLGAASDRDGGPDR